MISALQQFLREDEGVDAIEYGIMVALIFLVIVASVTFFASQATANFDRISSSMNTSP